MTSRRSRNSSKPLSFYTSPIRELLYAAERYGSEFDSLPTERVVQHLRECILIAHQQTELVAIALRLVAASEDNEHALVVDWLNRLRVDFNSVVADAQRLLNLAEHLDSL